MFFDDLADVGNLISGSSTFSKTSLNIWKFMVHVLLKPGVENLLHCYSIQVSEETGEVVWYFQLFKNFPEFVVMHIVKGFSKVNETEVDVFLELSCLSMI